MANVTASWLLVGSLAATTSGAESLAPRAWSNAQVLTRVAASAHLHTLPRNLTPPLAQLPSDSVDSSPLHTVGDECLSVTTRCTFGDRASKRVVVLFGDSHAWMWLPALNPEVTRRGFRLQLLWMPACPVASVRVYYEKIHRLYNDCVAWRTQTLALLARERPRLIIMSERTTTLLASPSTLVRTKSFQDGLTATLRQLQKAKLRVVLLVDLPAHPHRGSPAACLAQYPRAIERCAILRVSPLSFWATRARVERAVAARVGVAVIDPTSWLCAPVSCYPVVGSFATYYDWSHVSATYAAQLAGVMGAALNPLLA